MPAAIANRPLIQMRCRMQVLGIDAIVLDDSVKGMPGDVAGFPLGDIGVTRIS